MSLVFIKALLVLAGVFLLIYLVFIVTKNWLLHRASHQTSHINVIEQRRVDQHLTITLVAINDEHLALAVGKQGLAWAKLERIDILARARIEP